MIKKIHPHQKNDPRALKEETTTEPLADKDDAVHEEKITDPDIIPDEELFEDSSFEAPEPGEGP